jgi:hypothetical protein
MNAVPVLAHGARLEYLMGAVTSTFEPIEMSCHNKSLKYVPALRASTGRS